MARPHTCSHTDGTSHPCTCPTPTGDHEEDIFSHFFIGYTER